jgi:hypothetical protein
MSGLTLYAITQEYRAAADRLAELDLPPECVQDTLDGLAGELETKAQSVVAVARNIEALAASIKQAEADMTARRKALEKRAAWLREYVLMNMQAAGIEKIECPQFRITVRTNPEAVDVFDADQVPAEYLRAPEPPPPVVDKAAIKDALRFGKDVPGARLVRGQRLEVK